MPRFSVVIPTYNRAHYLKSALLSVLNQTCADYEIIIVDDGSTDETKNILLPYLNRIRYVYQSNQGRSKARNTALESARGEWIAFLDSDDEWLPDKLRRQLDFILKNPDCAMVHGLVNVIGENGEPLRRRNEEMRRLWIRSNGRGVTYEGWALECRCLLSSVLIRRDCLLQAGPFDETIFHNEELDLFLRIAAAHKIGFVAGEPLLHYRLYPGNSGSDNLSRGSVQVAEKHLGLLESPAFPVNRRVARRNFQLRLSRSYFMLGDKRNGRKHFLSALTEDLSALWISPHLWLFGASFLPESLKSLAARS